MTTPTAPSVQPGDLLRVTEDGPYGTTFRTNDLVTVTHLVEGVIPGTRRGVPAARVNNGAITVVLPLEVLEVADLPPYTWAEPDELVDTFFTSIIGADPELAALVETATAELDAADDPLAAGMHKAHNGTGAAELADPYHYEDEDEDVLDVHYYKADHGDTVEAGFLFQLNDGWIKVPVQEMRGLLDYLVAGMRKAQKKDNG